MAVEAARDALVGRDRASIAALRFASTTFPFLDRLHSGIVAGALSLDDGVSTIDIAATQRAGTSALIEALGGSGETLVVAAEKRDAKAASPVEMSSGDGAAAILVGEGKPVAKLLGQGLAHGRLRRSLPLRRQPVRLPVGGALDPRCRLHADRAAGDQALPGGGQGRSQGRDALLHAGDACTRRQLGRQGGRHRRQGDLRSAARQLRRHRRRASRWCCWRRCSRRPRPATRSWWSASARARTRCCSR